MDSLVEFNDPVVRRFHDLEKLISKIEEKKSLSKYESVEYYNKLLEMNDIRFMMNKKMGKK